MKNLTLSSKNLLIYRIIFASLSWFTFIAGPIIYAVIYGLPFLEWFVRFITFSIQTNFIITLWFTLAILWHNKPESLSKIMGPLKGAFTLYITITFVVFAVLLSSSSPTTGWAAFSNIVVHYITPIAFIIDWILTEIQKQYKWNYLLYWMIYPLCYILFAVIFDIITGDFIYYFFDINHGIPVLFMYISGLIAFGIALGCLYIGINRRRTKE